MWSFILAQMKLESLPEYKYGDFSDKTQEK
jgi:hypothetical protein